MELMEPIADDYNWYWETKLFLQNEELELESWLWDDTVSGSNYDSSSSPDGPILSASCKNIESERNRRKKLNDRLFTLRSIVPKISKMDKASIIKDSIDYIQELHEQERKMRTEITELEMGLEDGSHRKKPKYSRREEDEEPPSHVLKKKRAEVGWDWDAAGKSPRTPLDILDLSVTEWGEETLLVRLTCSKKSDAMVKLCEAFDSLKLKIKAANIIASSNMLLKTAFVEANVRDKDLLKERIQAALKDI